MIKSIIMIFLKLLFFSFIFILSSNCEVLNHTSEEDFLSRNNNENNENNENSEESINQITSGFVYLDDAKNLDNGYGTFQDSLRCLAKENSTLLNNGSDKDYLYGERLDNGTYDIYDRKNSGLFDTRKYFRIVYDSENILSELNLMPVAQDLTNKITPPFNQIYIDPNIGSFIFPRPIYWCKCEDVDEFIYPEINERVVAFNDGGNVFTTGATGAIGGPREMGKWGYSIRSIVNQNGEAKLYPTTMYTKMTISFWLKLRNELGETPSFSIHFDAQTQISFSKLSGVSSWQHKIYSTFAHADYDADNSDFNDFRLVYITFEHINVVTRKVQVFIDNAKVMEAIFHIEGNMILPYPFCFCFSDGNNNSGGNIWIDNIKIWKEVVSETSDWLYNNGDGREDALHYIYGESNEYKLQNIKVGYYYIN